MVLDEPAISEVWPANVAAAERSLLALALHGTHSVFNTGIQPRQFFGPQHQAVFEAALAVHAGTGRADCVTVGDELAKRGRLDACGGFAWLSKLLLHTPDQQLADHYAEIVRTAWTSRELLRTVSEVPRALSAGDSVYSVADRLRRFIDRIEGSEVECTSLETELTTETSRIAADLKLISQGAAPESGLPSGLGLDVAVPGGIPRDRLTLLFGETGTYKTAIKQWICDTIAASGKYVLDFSLEDSAQLTAQRYLARKTGIPYGRIAARELTQAEQAQISGISAEAHEVAARVIVVGNVPGTIEEAIRLSRQWARKVPLAAVFLDYLQILDQGREEYEAKAIYKMCVQAQKAAKRDRLAWVLVSQVNRDGNARPNKRPVLGDLYGSSGIAQTTKLALGVYRPAKYEVVPDKKSPWYDMFVNSPTGHEDYANALELWVRKSVAGETDIFVPLLIDRPTGVIRPLRTEDLA